MSSAPRWSASQVLFATGSTAWSPFFPLPPGTGAAGWDSPLWPHRDPIAYEAVYAGPYSMYSLVRWTRNLYIHGPDHVRTGLFASMAQLEAYILGAFPWLVVELWRVDQMHGGSFTAQTLSDAGGVGGSANTDYNVLDETIAEAAAAATSSAPDAQSPVSPAPAVTAAVAVGPRVPDPELWGPVLACHPARKSGAEMPEQCSTGAPVGIFPPHTTLRRPWMAATGTTGSVELGSRPTPVDIADSGSAGGTGTWRSSRRERKSRAAPQGYDLSSSSPGLTENKAGAARMRRASAII